MAKEIHKSGLPKQPPDISQTLQDAQNRWLRPIEIYGILRSYKSFSIAPAPPNRPPSGSLFLFDRKITKFFRKDGHNWKKKKDGKIVGEGHERLKVDNVDVLKVYYAHGEENRNFQRRTYWLLEEEFTNIVLVHYLEVRGSKQSFSHTKEAEISGISNVDNPACSNSFASQSEVANPTMDAESPITGQYSEYEDAETDNSRASSIYHHFIEMQQPVDGAMMDNLLGAPAPSTSENSLGCMFNEAGAGLRSGSKTMLDSVQLGEPVPEYSTGFMEPTLHSSVSTRDFSNIDHSSRLETSMSKALYTNNLTQKEAGALSAAGMPSSQNDSYTDKSIRYPLSLDVFKTESDGLNKFDSFSRWDQMFCIIDFSPSWAYTCSNTKVLIAGKFLANKEEVQNCKWSCMFGDVEVLAEVLADSFLRCYTPVHQSGRVPFYVTCSNRLACSEVREFEFRDSEAQYMETADPHAAGVNEMHLHFCLEKLLFLRPDDYEKYVLSGEDEKSELINTISLLMLDDKLLNLSVTSDERGFLSPQNQNYEKLVKEKLYYWLIHNIHDDRKSPNMLGKDGQGVIHLVAALGYDWAIRPIIAAGVHVNSRDARGWTALHWAASCGRERTVGTLIENEAASGALTDPTPQFPSGRTPADLASENGHKGIAGFLAESSLTSHLSAFALKESEGDDLKEIYGSAVANEFAGSSSTQLASQDSQAGSLKDALTAVRKSAQAASRISQALRMESFHRNKVVEYGDDDGGLSDQRTLPLVSLKNARPGQNDMLHSAAHSIQKKFRGWKGRKEFMMIRQKIIKIQMSGVKDY